MTRRAAAAGPAARARRARRVRERAGELAGPGAAPRGRGRHAGAAARPRGRQQRARPGPRLRLRLGQQPGPARRRPPLPRPRGRAAGTTGSGVTVLDEQFDTVYPTTVDPEGATAHRAHPRHRAGQADPGRVVRGGPGAGAGRRRASCAGTASGGSPACPRGCSCGCRTCARTTAPSGRWFVDPVRRRRRAGPALPARLSGARAGRPRDGAAARRAVDGACRARRSSMLRPGAQLRSNVATSPEGALDRRPDPGRRPGRGRSPAARGPGGALAGRGERRAGPAARRRRAAAGRPPRPDPRRRRGR